MKTNKIIAGIIFSLIALTIVALTCAAIYEMMTAKPMKRIITPKNPYLKKINLKYPKEFAELRDVTLKIKSNIVKEVETKIRKGEEKKTITEYYDKNNNKIYKITQNDFAYYSGGAYGGSRGSLRVQKYFAPFEEGVLYDEKGRILYKTELNKAPGYEYSREGQDKYAYLLRIEKNLNSLVPERGYGNLKFTEYKYDEKGEVSEERIRWMSISNIEFTDRFYENGKLRKEHKVIDDEGDRINRNLIFVEIEKEYDENGKMVRKHVTRKNKERMYSEDKEAVANYNPNMRSETEFDLIKGEIVTKYYDGEKVFATVTETLVGGNKAIVKRERDGDEFVIWDLVRKADKGNGRVWW